MAVTKKKTSVGVFRLPEKTDFNVPVSEAPDINKNKLPQVPDK